MTILSTGHLAQNPIRYLLISFYFLFIYDRTQIIESRIWMFVLSLLVRFGKFVFFLYKAYARGVTFCCALTPVSKSGNFGRLSVRFNFLSSYCIKIKRGRKFLLT